MLLFKKKFLPAILSGEKTQTIRLWKHRRVRAGQRSYIPGVGYIRIHAVDEITLDQLDEEDARRDGFESLASLLHEVETLYAEQIEAGYKVFRLRFEVMSQEAVAAEKARENAAVAERG